MFVRFTAPILALALVLPFNIWAASGSRSQHGTGLAAAQNLQADAKEVAASRRPLLILFSETGCVWCERARNEFLLPMQGNASYRSRVLFRQIDIDKDTPLTGFDGGSTTHKDLARALKVTRFPTVMLLGADGKTLAEPLVGFGIADFYGAYLDERIKSARSKLATGGATGVDNSQPHSAPKPR